ncbi:glycosyltransferase [Sphingobacterium sp. BIGb0116]|uniref:glycosyltransferase n=1 Tax=Sphingobacterium sp. BIGb0116 TaxID=2940619 RepID=UPI00216A9CFB|nr:glycosyltransferase family 2 protein [Sphingobacterium sp. BIGb0116]MCS4166238.1 GT2 family glycosyltransferase [Sphingobacterium sp. BIGb0116]
MINLSIVLYNTPKQDIENIFSSLEYVKSLYKLYVIDNSPKDLLRNYFIDKPHIIYRHNPSNPGFGASHNIALEISIKESVDFHFVINPDVYFKDDVITRMVKYMVDHTDVGMMMPEILNLDGSIQSLPKLLPSPLSIILRKLQKPKFIYNKFIDNYELRSVEKNVIYNAPILSGCFTLFRVSALKDIGLYDDNFFMYFEDWDISRRMHRKYKTVYFPKVSIFHGYESGANKSSRLFKIFLKSAKFYFNKWGWIFDRERVEVNKNTLNQFK